MLRRKCLLCPNGHTMDNFHCPQSGDILPVLIGEGALGVFVRINDEWRLIDSLVSGNYAGAAELLTAMAETWVKTNLLHPKAVIHVGGGRVLVDGITFVPDTVWRKLPQSPGLVLPKPHFIVVSRLPA